MKINYNISAMIANGQLNKSDNALSTSLERLSSGYKINHAKDNASGLAMAKRMNAQIRSLETANQNSNDGISVIEIAEGALSEIEDMVQRMNELAVKACNGTIENEEREYINDEITQLKAEIERIAATTMYNGETLLNGDFDLKGYSSNANLKVMTYSDEVRAGAYRITLLSTEFDTDGKMSVTDFAMYDNDGKLVDVECKVEDNYIYLTGANNFAMTLKVENNTEFDLATTHDIINLDITGLGAMKVQTGTGEGQQLDVRIPTINLEHMGLGKLDVLTKENAEAFLAQMNGTLSYINDTRSRLGAYQNRLEHTVNTLDISEENMTGAYARIMDVDMAEEMTEYSKNQVLVQAGTSMLAQANERPAQVLQLLQ